MNLFIDTSALVKLYHKEDGSEQLTDFLKQNEDDIVITISDLSRIEFHSAFLKRVRMKEIDFSTVQQAFKEFENDLTMINVVETTSEVKEFAISLLDNIAPDKNLRTLDALQLATALTVNQFYRVSYFIAADQRLLEVAAEYFDTFDPVEFEEADNTESQFTKPAKKFWDSIPENIREELLENVWCSNCSEVTTIINFKGTIESGDLILRGECRRCGYKVARLVESE